MIGYLNMRQQNFAWEPQLMTRFNEIGFKQILLTDMSDMEVHGQENFVALLLKRKSEYC